MKYLQKSFSVLYGGKAYNAGWEQTFGKDLEYKTYFERIDELSKLSNGWLDGEEGQAISSSAQLTARIIGQILKEFGVVVPFLYPNPNGGMDIEWDHPAITICINAVENEPIHWFGTNGIGIYNQLISMGETESEGIIETSQRLEIVPQLNLPPRKIDTDTTKLFGNLVWSAQLLAMLRQVGLLKD